MRYRLALQVLCAKVNIAANREELLPRLPFKVEVPSLLTDFRRVEPGKPVPHPDGACVIEDADVRPEVRFADGRVLFRGPFLRLERTCSDPRYTLWGNQGFFYRYALSLLERKHGIFTLHACALVNERGDTMVVAPGGAGSGKTVFLLRGLELGWQVFSTESVHFQPQGEEILWYGGPLVDNIRVGTLVQDFPSFLPKDIAQQAENAWEEKIALNLSRFQHPAEKLERLKSVIIVLPRIEHGFKDPSWNPIGDTRKATQRLFENISQKITETVLLYDTIAVPGQEEPSSSQKRLSAVQDLLANSSLNRVVSVNASPRNCWDGILNNLTREKTHGKSMG